LQEKFFKVNLLVLERGHVRGELSVARSLGPVVSGCVWLVLIGEVRPNNFVKVIFAIVSSTIAKAVV